MPPPAVPQQGRTSLVNLHPAGQGGGVANASRSEEATTRLSALDAAFLHFETDGTPAHVGTVAFFEGAPFRDAEGRFRLAEVRSRIKSRLHLVPRLRQVVRPTPLGVAHPVLADDRYFDIVHHVKLVEVGAPADEAAVLELAATLHMERLDRDRPLWELVFVDGMADGRVALVEKIHHAIVDGVSGVEVSTVLLDLERETDDHDAPAWYPHAWESPVERLAKGAVQRVGLALGWTRDTVVGLRHPSTPGDLKALSGSLSLAPQSSLNREVGHQRRLEAVRRDLELVRSRAHEFGGTVNDLVLSAVTSGLRDLLLHRDDAIDESTPPLRALIPVSLHEEHGDIGNRVAALVADLPIGIADPVERLQHVAQEMESQKSSGMSAASGRLVRGIDLVPANVAALLSRVVHRQPLVNIVITNVPGPDLPLYAVGAKMLDAIPIVPLAGNLTIAVGVLSYNGRLVLGLHADPEACDDLDVFVAGVESGFDALGCYESSAGTKATGQGA